MRGCTICGFMGRGDRFLHVGRGSVCVGVGSRRRLWGSPHLSPPTQLGPHQREPPHRISHRRLRAAALPAAGRSRGAHGRGLCARRARDGVCGPLPAPWRGAAGPRGVVPCAPHRGDSGGPHRTGRHCSGAGAAGRDGDGGSRACPGSPGDGSIWTKSWRLLNEPVFLTPTGLREMLVPVSVSPEGYMKPGGVGHWHLPNWAGYGCCD